MSKQEENLSFEQMRQRALTANKLHHTIGVYANGEYKENAVPDFELEGHIEYNKHWRWGRALFVDGKCVHRGYLSEEECSAFEEKIKDWSMPPVVYPRQ